MKGTQSFLIRAKPSLLAMLEGVDAFFHHLQKDVVLTAELSDRHGMEFEKIFEQIKICYLESVSRSLAQIRSDLGFDYYWTFERYEGRVIALSEVLQRIGQINANTSNRELNYLIKGNAGVADQ